MTKSELRVALIIINVTQEDVAKAIGVNPSTLRRWLAGLTPVPKPAGKLIHLMSLGLVAFQAVKNTKG